MSATLEVGGGGCGQNRGSTHTAWGWRGNSHLGSGDVGQLGLAASLPFTAGGVCRKLRVSLGELDRSFIMVGRATYS